MDVMTTHSDPRSGEVVYKLTNINRANPSRTLFEPPDYTVMAPATGTGRGGRGAGKSSLRAERNINPKWGSLQALIQSESTRCVPQSAPEADLKSVASSGFTWNSGAPSE